MKGSTLRFILALSLLLNVSMLVSAGYTHYRQSRYQAFPVGHDPYKPGAHVPDHLFERLSLKPDQLKTIQQKAIAFHDDLNRKAQQIDQKRIALVTLIRDDNPDSKAIDAAIAEINSLQMGVQKLAVAHMLEFKGMLDEDQQKRFFDFIAQAMSGKQGTQCP